MPPNPTASIFQKFLSLFRRAEGGDVSHTYCTYFDIRYLDKGLCLYNSLRSQLGDVELWVLCLDSEVLEKLQRLNLPGIRILRLDELERADPALKACRGNRRLVEYYFTSTPCLVNYLLQRVPKSGWVTYLDADLFFFGSPAPILEEMAAGDVAIIPHRFSEKQKHLEIYGKYNVGWVSFRNSPAGIRCVKWWRKRCLEWCKDVPEKGKFADQKYLDQFHKITRSELVIIRNPGANFAPWNLPNHTITKERNRVELDGHALIFFHFHDCKRVGERRFDPGLVKYGHILTEVVRDDIYLPYLRLLMEKWQNGNSSTIRFDGVAVHPGKSELEDLIEVPIQ